MNGFFKYFKAVISDEISIPMLIEDGTGPRYFYRDKAIKNPEIMKFKIREPVPRRVEMADFLFTPNILITRRIFDIIESLKVNGIQLFPSLIRDQKNSVSYDDYWSLHIFKKIKCIDEELSDCEIDDGIDEIEKIVLDKKKLQQIPLEERLIFRLEEDWSFKLFHESVVNKIMATKPSGVRFVNIEEYNDGVLFD